MRIAIYLPKAYMMRIDTALPFVYLHLQQIIKDYRLPPGATSLLIFGMLMRKPHDYLPDTMSSRISSAKCVYTR